MNQVYILIMEVEEQLKKDGGLWYFQVVLKKVDEVNLVFNWVIKVLNFVDVFLVII